MRYVCDDDCVGEQLAIMTQLRSACDYVFEGISGGVERRTALVCTALSSSPHAHLAEGLYRAETDQPCYYQTPVIFFRKTWVHESEATCHRYDIHSVQLLLGGLIV